MSASQNSTTITPTLIHIIEYESDDTFLGLAPVTINIILIALVLLSCATIWVLILLYCRLQSRVSTLKQFAAVDQASFVAPLPQSHLQQHHTRPSHSYLYAHGAREPSKHISRDVSHTYHTQRSKPQSNTRVCESDPEQLWPSPHNLTVNRVHLSAQSQTTNSCDTGNARVSATHTPVHGLLDCDVDVNQHEPPINKSHEHCNDGAVLSYVGLTHAQPPSAATVQKLQEQGKARDNYKPTEKFVFPSSKPASIEQQASARAHFNGLKKFRPRGAGKLKARDSLIVNKLLKAAKHSPAPAPLAVNRNAQNTNANMIRRPCKIVRSTVNKSGVQTGADSSVVTSTDDTYQTSTQCTTPSSSLMSSQTRSSLGQCDDARSNDETVQIKIIDDDEFDKENENDQNVRNSVMEYKYSKFFGDANHNRLEYDLGRKMSRSTSTTGQNASCKTMIIHADDSARRTSDQEETDSVSSLPHSSYQHEGVIAQAFGNGTDTVQYYE